MVIGTKIPKHKSMSKDKDILVLNKPKTVYIPLIVGNDTDLVITVNKGDYIYKGSEIAHRKGNLALPIHSSVSGTLIDFVDKTCGNGNKVKCAQIENDFKECVKDGSLEEHKLSDYDKTSFINKIKDCGIRGLGGADFPTYIKYSSNNPIKYLIVNAVECEPYITADYALMKQNYEFILECIDAIMEINKIENAYIAIKKHNTDIVNLFNNFIGTYPNIHIVSVPNLYPMGWEKNLVRYILKEDYQKLPIECGVVINNVSTIYAIYEALRYSKPLTERVVTISGEMVKNPINVSVKIGTEVSEILDKVGIKKKNYTMISGGPMMGKNILEDDLVTNSNLNCILLLEKEKDSTPLQCLRCGKCADACPAKLSPVLIKDNVNNIDNLKKLEVNRCVECGLCSYVCPSKILVREYVRQAKSNLRREQDGK